eukprot:COSAG05_NODE_1175_length_5616_cov_2.565343_5_plen_142_part_00
MTLNANQNVQPASLPQQSMQPSMKPPYESVNMLQVSAFVMEQLKEQLKEQRAQDSRQHQEMISLLMKQHEVKLHCVTDEQLMSLQARLETLHSSSLLTDDVRSIVQACMQGLVLTRTDYCYMRVGTVGARGHHRRNDRRCN